MVRTFCREAAPRKTRKTPLVVAAAVLLVLFSFALVHRAHATVDTVYVYSFDFSLNPQGQPVVDAVITQGDTIRWVRQEGNHTTTSVVGSGIQWDAPLDNTTPTFTLAFPSTGTFVYYCKPHGFDNGDGTAGGMSGTITVLPGGLGASCFPTGCEETTAAQALLRGGTFQGVGTTCETNPCPNAPVTVTLNAVADNTLYEDPAGTVSNGVGQYLFTGNQNNGRKRRTVVRFDVSAIPSAALIQSATLRLFCSQASGVSITMPIHRLTATWGEGTSQGSGNESAGGAATTNDATWLHRFYNTTLWTALGGDFAATASATPAVPATAGVFQDWTGVGVSADVQHWVDGSATNAGWVIRGDEASSTNGRRFASRETATLANRPSLTVTFLPSAPTGAACFNDGTCQVMTEAAAVAAGAVYRGDNTTCTPNPCTVVLTAYVDELPRPGVAAPTFGTVGGAATYIVPMQEVHQKLHRDLPPTTFWGYGGSYPGPTIEASVGNPVTVTWVSDLRDSTGALRTTHYLPLDECLEGPDMFGQAPRTVVHLHGGHVPPASDGYPETTMLPGERQTFHYPNIQKATTLWYHDHALGITRINVMMGLAGFYLLRDAAENALGLPAGEYEIPLAIQDRAVTADGHLIYPAQWMEHFFGDKAVVNGKIWPYLNVKRGKYRFRMLNGSNSRTYTFHLSNGTPFAQIGSDGGLLAAPVSRDSMTLAPGERADVIVDFGALAPGTEIVLTNSAPAPFPVGSTTEPALPNIMKFIVGSVSGHTTAIPATLTTVTRIPESEAVQSRDFALARTPAMGSCGGYNWTINGLHWKDITEFPVLNTAEIWRFINHSETVHPMHMHLVEFQILDRQKFTMNGDSIQLIGAPTPPTPDEAGWKDTTPVYPNEVVRVIARFEDYTGKYPYHCHVLEHEDHDMMRQFYVASSPVTGVDPSSPRYRLALHPARPNPFNPSVRLSYEIPRGANVRLDVFDVAGRLVTTLIEGPLPAGPGSVTWDGRDRRGAPVGSGVYVYKLRVAGSPDHSRKMVLLK